MIGKKTRSDADLGAVAAVTEKFEASRPLGFVRSRFRDDKDRPEWDVGRVHETRGGPDSLRWFWSMTGKRSDDALWPRGDLGRG